MIIYLKAGGILKPYLKPDVDEYTRKADISAGDQLHEILKKLNIPPSLVAMAMVNGKMVPLTYSPAENEIITLRPPVQGG